MKHSHSLHLLTTLMLSLLTMYQTNAATYYCSPNGKNDGSSYKNPCSFSDGISKLKSAGDTLYLLGGTYNLGNTQIGNKNGNSTQNIVISGYPGEKAILDFRSTPYGTRGLQVKGTCTYLHIKNLTLCNSGKNNLYNEGSNCRFENLDIYGSADTGCQMKNGGNNLIINVDSHHNFDYEHYGSSGADFGGNADGFADKQHSGASNTYIGCRSWGNSDDGWDFFQRNNSDCATPTIFENCICYQNGPEEYNMKNHPRYEVDKAWFDGINGTKITNRYGEEQVVTLEHYPNHGNGNGFKIGGDNTTHNVTIHHCLAVANTVKGFDQNNNAGTMRIYNNTGYKNGNNMGFHNGNNGSTLYIQNCVSFQSRGADMLTAGTIAANDHNTWNNGFKCSASDFVSIDTTKILSARNADGTYPETVTKLFALTPGSQLIDAGTNVGYLYMGSAPDLGWQESDGTIQPALWFIQGPAEQVVAAGDSIQPVILGWMGCDERPSTSGKPSTIVRKVSNNAKTLTFTGVIETPGVYTLTSTTVCGENDATLRFTIHVREKSSKRVAYVTTPGSAEDQAILAQLNSNTDIVVTETDAADNSIDYSGYDLIILGAKPSSSASGFVPLKHYSKPMLLLKPFLLKASVWGWGNAVNTSDVSISITESTHPIFTNITLTDNTLQVFDACNTNAVTAISSWTNTNAKTLATPISNSAYTCVAEIEKGALCGGVEIAETMLMLGYSEYSSANLSENGLHLLDNCVCYLLGLHYRTDIVTGIMPDSNPLKARKQLTPNGIIILRGNESYSITGQKIGTN